MGRVGPSVAVGPVVGLAGAGVGVAGGADAGGADVGGIVELDNGVALARSGVEVSVGLEVAVGTAATCSAGETVAVTFRVERRPLPVLRIPLASNRTAAIAISTRAPSPNKIGKRTPPDLAGAAGIGA